LQIKEVYKLVKNGLDGLEEQFRLLAQSQDDAFPELHKMLSHILCGGGKAVRPLLALHAGSLYQYERQKMMYMAAASELMHIATLVHDDAIDKASVRRGRLTINKIWGVDKAIIFGDYLFAKAAEYAVSTGSLRVVGLFAQTLEAISYGELKQGFSAFNLEQTFDDYIGRITGKTASLFALATEGGAVLSQAPEGSIHILKEYGLNLGISFQIVDDILDFIGTEKELGKPVGSDLAQGTITLPSLLILEHYPEDNPIKRVFRNEGDKEENIKEAIELLRSNSQIVDQCYHIASDYSDKARCNLDRLPDGPSRQALHTMSDYVVKRKK
jgi:octaprenyl-diphosphate synthase